MSEQPIKLVERIVKPGWARVRARYHLYDGRCMARLRPDNWMAIERATLPSTYDGMCLLCREEHAKRRQPR